MNTHRLSLSVVWRSTATIADPSQFFQFECARLAWLEQVLLVLDKRLKQRCGHPVCLECKTVVLSPCFVPSQCRATAPARIRWHTGVLGAASCIRLFRGRHGVDALPGTGWWSSKWVTGQLSGGEGIQALPSDVHNKDLLSCDTHSPPVWHCAQ